MNQVIKVRLEVTTPVHISSGKDILSHEYVIKDNIFYRFSLQKFVKGLSASDRESFLKEIAKDNKPFYIRRFIHSFVLDHMDDILFDYRAEVSKKGGEVDGRFVENLISSIYDQNFKGNSFQGSNSLIIKEFVGVHGKKYIPGSSIKGAIRTALINEIFSKDYSLLTSGGSNIPNDYFKDLIITDSNLFNEGLFITAINRTSKNNFVEALKEGTSCEFMIKIRSDKHFKKDDMIKAMNAYAIKELNYYIPRLMDVNNMLLKKSTKMHQKKHEKNCTIINQFENILSLVKGCRDDEFYMNLGFGGGAIFKTVEESVSNRKRLFTSRMDKLGLGSLEIPRTCSLIEGSVMGWVKCKIIG